MMRLVTILFLIVPVLVSAQENHNSFSTITPSINSGKLLFVDNIQWYGFNLPQSFYDYTLQSNSLYNEINRDPYYADFSGSSVVASWDDGYLSGYGVRETFPGLMQNETGGFVITQHVGAIVITGGVSADKYGFYRGFQTQYGIHGTITYRLNDYISLTAFGSHYNNSLYISPAMMPFIKQSSYGGYVDIGFNEKFGVDLGVQRTHNSWSGVMEIVPIVRPYYKISKNSAIKIDAGYLIRDILFDNRRGNPTMTPPRPEIPIAPRRD